MVRGGEFAVVGFGLKKIQDCPGDGVEVVGGEETNVMSHFGWELRGVSAW